MTRILTIFLLLLATPAWAQLFAKGANWSLVLTGEYGKYYVDTKSIKARGNTFEFVFLSDLYEHEDGHSSIVYTQTLDCSKLKWKNRAVQFWTGNMASGKIETEATWSPERQYWDDVHPMKNVDFYNLVKKLCSD